MAKFIFTNKLKIFISILLIAVSILIAIRGKGEAKKNEIQSEKKPTEVSVKTVSELKNSNGNLRFAASVVADQEIKITSQASGVIQSVNFDLGDRVAVGKVLITIDDQGNLLAEGKNNFKSAQVQQMELAVKQAKESYELAKDKYSSDKADANKSTRDIARLQYESAKVALENSLNARTITSPISGSVTSRQVSIGDAVSMGQILATVSRTNLNKIQFYLSTDEIKNIKIGNEIEVGSDPAKSVAKIINISPQADKVTGKFLIEATPEKGSMIKAGTVVDVWIQTVDKTNGNGIFLPLSAISNKQTESYIFAAQGDIAKKLSVTVANISGEIALTNGDFSDDTQIIVDGNKLIGDGDKIQIK